MRQSTKTVKRRYIKPIIIIIIIIFGKGRWGAEVGQTLGEVRWTGDVTWVYEVIRVYDITRVCDVI